MTLSDMDLIFLSLISPALVLEIIGWSIIAYDK